MERIDEAWDTQESSRRGAGQVRRAGAQRCQAAGEPGKWPQGRLGQKPQEGHGGAPQCTPTASWASEELVNRVMMPSINSHELWLRLHEKGGKRHEVPCHAQLEEYLQAWIAAARIASDKKGPLFRSVGTGER